MERIFTIFSEHYAISIPGGLVTLVIKRSLDQFAGVGSSLGHKNDMFCLPGVVFFLAKFPLSSNLINEWAQMHLIILRGRNPRRPVRIHLFVCKKSSSAHSRRASRQLLAKEYALKTG